MNYMPSTNEKAQYIPSLYSRPGIGWIWDDLSQKENVQSLEFRHLGEEPEVPIRQRHMPIALFGLLEQG